MQELIETFEEMRSPIDSKVDVDFAISLVKSMLEKEKEVMIDYAVMWRHEDFSRKEIAKHYNETFKTKEK